MKYQYDRPALKLEFFESEFDEVQPFFKKRYNKDTTKFKQIAINTKGRAKEKQQHKMKIVEDALKRNAEKQAQELSVPLDELMKGKKAIIQLLLAQVGKYVKDNRSEDGKLVKDVDVANAEKILRMFKTELGEPNTIGANYNMNANKVEGLTDEESEALDILFNEKVGKNKKQ